MWYMGLVLIELAEMEEEKGEGMVEGLEGLKIVVEMAKCATLQDNLGNLFRTGRRKTPIRCHRLHIFHYSQKRHRHHLELYCMFQICQCGERLLVFEGLVVADMGVWKEQTMQTSLRTPTDDS